MSPEASDITLYPIVLRANENLRHHKLSWGIRLWSVEEARGYIRYIYSYIVPATQVGHDVVLVSVYVSILMYEPIMCRTWDPMGSDNETYILEKRN